LHFSEFEFELARRNSVQGFGGKRKTKRIHPSSTKSSLPAYEQEHGQGVHNHGGVSITSPSLLPAPTFVPRERFTAATSPTCPFCHRNFDRQRKLDLHLKNIHEFHDRIAPKCSICWKYFYTVEACSDHVALHNPEFPFSCVLCQKVMKDVTELISHVLKDHEGKRYRCSFDACLQTHVGFRFPSDMKSHLSIDHNLVGDETKLLHHCLECKLRFKEPAELQRHHMRHHVKEPHIPCTVCGKFFFAAKDMRRHIRSFHTTLRMNPKCKFCAKTFESTNVADEHERLHSLQTPFDCVLCQRSFTTSNDLHRHVLSTHETLVFKCPHAGCEHEAFDTKPKLAWHRWKKHVVTETEGSHPCPHCPFRGHNPSSLKFHMFAHAKEKVFQCPVEGCERSFAWKHQRELHVRKVHKIGPEVTELFKCKVCARAFDSKCRLKNHEIYHGDQREFMCELCSATFKIQRDLKRHMKLHAKESAGGGGTPLKVPRVRKSRLPSIRRNGVEVGDGGRK